MMTQAEEPPDYSLRDEVIEKLMDYLKERNQEECADYFTLRLMDLPTQEIETILNLTPASATIYNSGSSIICCVLRSLTIGSWCMNG